MQYSQKFTNLIFNSENRKAMALANEIYASTHNRGYADALVKISLVEAAKQLRHGAAHFYIDEEELITLLFSEGSDGIIKAIDLLCSAARDSSKEDKYRSFQKAKAFIMENIRNNQLSAEQVADYIGSSPSGLVKLFCENAGTTPGDFIGRKRVEESIAFLEADKNVSEAAFMAGFSSVEGFIRTFKKYMGTTPGKWKRKNLSL